MTEPEDVSNNKRKWGQRGSNKMSSGVVYVIKLDSNGLPSEPPEVRKAFKRASGFQVRDNVPIDEDITPLDTNDTPPLDIQGAITRARA
jgi:hypothetical protein